MFDMPMLPLMTFALTLIAAPLDTSPARALVSPAVSRRAVLGILVAPAVALYGPPHARADEDECDAACEEKIKKALVEKTKARARAAAKTRLEDAKKGPLRKPTDLVENRRKTVDYSCVATTGSPCPTDEIPEPK